MILSWTILLIFSKSWNYFSIVGFFFTLLLEDSSHLVYIFFSLCNLGRDVEFLSKGCCCCLDYIRGNFPSWSWTFFYNSLALWILFSSHFCFLDCNIYRSCNLLFKLLFSFMSYLSCSACWSTLLTLFFLLYSRSLYSNPLFLWVIYLTSFLSKLSSSVLLLSNSSVAAKF